MALVCLLKFPKLLATYLSEIIELSEQAIVDWGNFVRETISHYYIENPQMLGGDQAVQIDESLFGGRMKYYRGDHSKHVKSWVFGIVEEDTKRCVFWCVDNRNRETLTNIISEHVLPRSTIKSNQWASYNGLNEEGFTHLTVNHSLEFVSQEGIHTQLIESTWSQLKSILKIKRGISKSHLPGYLDFYSFICDAKHQNKSIIVFFIELIQADNCYYTFCQSIS